MQDKCYSFAPDADKTEYEALKSRSPFGQLPVLEHIETGKLLGQSAMIGELKTDALFCV